MEQYYFNSQVSTTDIEKKIYCYGQVSISSFKKRRQTHIPLKSLAESKKCCSFADECENTIQQKNGCFRNREMQMNIEKDTMSSTQTFQSSKKRVGFVDLSKGFCICLVVLLHVFGETAGETFDMLNLFRMPLYFILSGMFFKRYGGFLDFFKKKTNKLLIPFLFTYLLTCIPSIFVLSSGPLSPSSFWNEESCKVNLGCNGAAWFLLCLFFQNIMFYLIYKASDYVFVVSSVSIVTGLVGYAMNVYGCRLPLWVDTAMTALPFFLFGYVLRKYSEVLYRKMNGMYMALTALALFVLMAVNHYNHVMGTTVLAYGDNVFNMNVICLYLGASLAFGLCSCCLNA